MNVRCVLLPFLLISCLTPVAAYAQAGVSPYDVYQSPGDPSWFTLTVYGGENVYVVVQFDGPSGQFFLDGTLDGSGQTVVDVGGWEVGQYAVTAVAYWGFYWVGAYAPFEVHPYEPPYPIVNSAAAGGNNRDMISAVGANFNQDSRVVVAGENWAYGQWYYASNWQMSPVVNVSPDGHSLSLQVIESNLLTLLRSGNARILVVDPDGNNSGWILVDPPPAPVVSASGAGGDNWDWIWASGANFAPDSRVVVAGENWAYGQWYYASNWQMSPVVNVSPDGQWLGLQVTDPNLRALFGWGGVYMLVVDPAGQNSGWVLVQSPQPVVTSVTPSCSDSYCMTISGSFPASASVGFRLSWTGEVVPNAYTDLVVTPTQITLRVNPAYRQDWDTAGLYLWVVNGVLPNWSGGTYVPPVDRAVIGNVDGVGGGGQQYYLGGWACAKTQATSIDVHVYVGGPAGGGGTMVFSGTANQPSEPGVAAACNSTGTNHRFYLAIPHWVTQNYGGQPIHVYGISPIGLANLPIGNSGNVTVPGVDRSITGWVSGVTVQGNTFYLYGWGCAKTYPGAIDVHVYVGGSSATGTFAFSGTANQATNDPAVAAACNAPDSIHRYYLQIPTNIVQQYAGQPIYVHGISPYGLPNLLLSGSGNFAVPGSAPTSLKEFIYLGDRVIAVISQ
jgi:hypothetical protein